VIGGSLSDVPAGRPALAIDVFQTGKAVAARARDVKHFLAFNQSDDACRVQDILTALVWLHKKYPGTVEIVGIGTAAGVWTEFAAAIAPLAVKLRNDIRAFHGTDSEFLQYFNVPGIQTAGGLAAAERLTAQLK
jgi:hypothetical protein